MQMKWYEAVLCSLIMDSKHLLLLKKKIKICKVLGVPSTLHIFIYLYRKKTPPLLSRPFIFGLSTAWPFSQQVRRRGICESLANC